MRKPKMPNLTRTKAAATAAPLTVVDRVRAQTQQAEALAAIAGQERLADPRTNPTLRPRHDRLRDEQQRVVLDAAHARVLRQHRVADAAAADAEATLQALALARKTTSPARSVLALHRGKKVYGRISMAASLVLACGSAMGVEEAAHAMATAAGTTVPTGTGWIAEVGLTGLSTIAILVRGHLAEHRASFTTDADKTSWQLHALVALMVVPLLASVAANLWQGNLLGAACAIGAAAFGVLAYIVADRSAQTMVDRAAEVDDVAEDQLRAVAGGGVFAPATPAPTPVEAETKSESAGLELVYTGPQSDHDVLQGNGWLTEEEFAARGLDRPETERPELDPHWQQVADGIDTAHAAQAEREQAEHEVEAFFQEVQEAARRAAVEAVQQAVQQALTPSPSSGDDGGDTAEIDDEVADEAAKGIAALSVYLADRPGDDPPGGPHPTAPPTTDDGDHGTALTTPADSDGSGTDDARPIYHWNPPSALTSDDRDQTRDQTKDQTSGDHESEPAREPTGEPTGESTGEPGREPGSELAASGTQALAERSAWRLYEAAMVWAEMPHTSVATMMRALGVSEPTVKRYRSQLRKRGWADMTGDQRWALVHELHAQAEKAARGGHHGDVLGDDRDAA